MIINDGKVYRVDPGKKPLPEGVVKGVMVYGYTGVGGGLCTVGAFRSRGFAVLF